MHGTTLGFCSISALDRPLAAAAELVAELGLDGIEVTARAPHLDPEASLAEARRAGRAVRSAGTRVLAYGSYLGREGERSAAAAAREVDRAAALGAPILRVWAEPGPAGSDLEEAAALLRHACDAAADPGIEVVVERHRGSFADTSERIAGLLDAVGRPNLSLNYQPLDLLPPAAVAEQPGDARRLAPVSRYLHVKNYRPNPDPEGPLLPGGSLGGGVLDWGAILEAAFCAGYAGPLVIEFLSFEPLPVEEKLAEDAGLLRRLVAAARR